MNWIQKLSHAQLPQNVQIDLTSQEDAIFTFIRSACQKIGLETGHAPTARVAGGWVRDKLLNRQSKDIDITVDMKGDEFAHYLRRIDPSSVSPIKTTEERPEQIKNLSVAFLRIFGQDIEILPLRGNEVYEEGNRNPVSTEEATPQDDAYRRDLTINTLFYNINDGRVEDFTGQGYSDLMSMTLRTPTRPGIDPTKEATRILSEDPLRLLRIIRFHSRYADSQIAPEVLEAMSNPDIQHQVVRRLAGDKTGGIVPERTADEMRKIMIGEQPEKAIRIMFETGLLQQMLQLPDTYHDLNMDQQNKHHSLTLINHTLEVLKNANTLAKEFGLDDSQRMMMNFTALFHDIGKLDPRSHSGKVDGGRGYSGDPSREDALSHQQASQERWNAFAKALKLSDEERRTVSQSVLDHMNPHAHVETGFVPSDKQMRKYIRKNPAWVFQYIHAMADSMSKTDVSDPSKTDPYRENLQRLHDLAPTADQFGDMGPAQDLLKGPEIIQMVGLPPRPPMGVSIGYIEIVKEIIRERQDEYPQLTPQEAGQIVQELVMQGQSGQGVLAPYFNLMV